MAINASITSISGVIYGDHGKKLAHWETDGSNWWFMKHTHPLDTLDNIRMDGVRLFEIFDLTSCKEAQDIAVDLYEKFHSGLHDAA